MNKPTFDQMCEHAVHIFGDKVQVLSRDELRKLHGMDNEANLIEIISQALKEEIVKAPNA